MPPCLSVAQKHYIGMKVLYGDGLLSPVLANHTFELIASPLHCSHEQALYRRPLLGLCLDVKPRLAVQYTGLCCAVLCCAVLCCAVLCCDVMCCAVLCCAVLCCAVLCCAVLCCAVL